MADRPKAYHNQDFLNSREARGLRILAEYLEPQARLRDAGVEDTIVFMGSARILSREAAEERLDGARRAHSEIEAAENALRMSAYYEATRELAYRLTEWSEGQQNGGKRYVVCSGGGPGIMEAANRGAHQAGGTNIGLTISLPFEEFNNPYVTPDLHFHFHYFFMRKFWFVYLAKAVVMMPGGFGTLDEFFEILTLVQTRKIRKPMPIVLYGIEYWSEVMNLEALVKYGMINPEDLALFHRCDSVDDAFDFITGQLTQKKPEPGAVL